MKALFGRRHTLQDTYGLAAKLDQARRGAHKVSALLRSHGLDVAVQPVLVLAGPGAPVVPGGAIKHEGVLVAAFRDSDDWRPVMAAEGQALPLATAAQAADRLLAFCDQRDQHQRTRHQRNEQQRSARKQSTRKQSTRKQSTRKQSTTEPARRSR
ncbi:hypothetical protein [Kineococcus aurantiacus]|uniref:Uncharacterized protein n=1 Tax=Kineococcus aurantiacus TaxID=37633 RepID=A0A7Y9J3I6_9ACTN|nr:hypothetical protein [Kineococcus aurantiacus]NYD25028.1 hypothetical protein [Kineococcus aurantiacus]